jgi:hypothetical protein
MKNGAIAAITTTGVYRRHIAAKVSTAAKPATKGSRTPVRFAVSHSVAVAASGARKNANASA